MDAIILAGGKGTRLSKILPNIPKPLAPINGIPFLDYLIKFLQNQNVEKIILSVGYEKDQIINRYKNHQAIHFSNEFSPLGTGGAIKKAIKLATTDNVLALNGDSYIEYSLKDFLNFHKNNNADLTILLNYKKDISRYGSITIDPKTKRILSFNEKIQKDSGFINSGVYLMKKSIFDSFNSEETFSIEQDFFPNIIKTKNVFGYEINSPFIDIGTENSYFEAQSFFKDNF